MQRGAAFSDCGTYRYALWRIWDTRQPAVLFIGLNPSTADAQKDDPTVRRCLGFARSWGAGALLMANLFAYRATDPGVLRRSVAPAGPDNDAWINRLTGRADMIVVAWGNGGAWQGRGGVLLRQLPRPLYHLGLTQAGHPRHPLFVPATQFPDALVTEAAADRWPAL